ncbi:MAG: hypothetical protein HOU81_08905 [Hamadaea sp.]|uniref:hypothetical protein n=1 Tax=Hamadaea sp. TaxID=2024425 RepID=UPI0017CC9604|nr:hypothetical protein [Hamadaea sp.]NUR70927.1 hypothetical protein [Hamadaea sp.]NUT21714.1 hypothetical protein [Hamadaea sp.]
MNAAGTVERSVVRSKGVFEFGNATLQTSWSWRRAVIRLGDREWTIHPTDRRRIGVEAYAGSGPAVRLHPQRSHVPGPGGPVRWQRGHRGARLERDGRSIDVQIPPLARRPMRVEVTGDWPDLELVVLSMVYALMTKRRRRTIMIVAIIGATGHGPVF